LSRIKQTLGITNAFYFRVRSESTFSLRSIRMQIVSDLSHTAAFGPVLGIQERSAAFCAKSLWLSEKCPKTLRRSRTGITVQDRKLIPERLSLSAQRSAKLTLNPRVIRI